MSAYVPHPVAVPPSHPGLPGDVFAPDPRDWLRMIGAVLLATGVAVLFVRQEPEWGNFPLFLIAFVPACVLYSLGFLGGLHDIDGERRPLGWQSVYLILGTALGGVAVAELLLLLGADSLNPRINQAILYFAIAALAFTAAFLRRVWVLTLVGGIAGLAGWVAFLGKIGSIESVGTYRVLILVYAAAALAGALALGAAKRAEAPDLVCVAGVGAIAAALLSLAGLAQFSGPLGDTSGEFPRPTEEWNVFLLVVALALIAYGTKARTRGPAYVGVLALAAFTGLTGAHAVALAHGDQGAHPGAWPLLLLIVGALVAAAGFVLERGKLGSLRGGPQGPGREDTAPRQRPQYPPPTEGSAENLWR